MCDISKPTKLKEITVYKVATKSQSGYLSAFVEAPIKLGEVKPFEMTGILVLKYGYNSALFNINMIRRSSGFKSKEAAQKLADFFANNSEDENNNENLIVLKIKLGGSIMRGTSNYIGGIDASHITYAGTEILSIEEI